MGLSVWSLRRNKQWLQVLKVIPRITGFGISVIPADLNPKSVLKSFWDYPANSGGFRNRVILFLIVTI